MSEPEDCIQLLDVWIKEHKDRIYNENIDTSKDDPSVIQEYEDTLANLAYQLIRAVEKEDENTLRELGWPDELINCSKDSSTQIVIIHRIELWLIEQQHTQSIAHLNQLEQENIGIN